MNELTVRLTNITKSYGNKDLFEIEELSAYIGDKIAIIGPNGTGKSTLLKIIKGELLPDNGRVQRETEFNYFAQIKSPAEFFSDEMDFKLLSHFRVPDNDNLSGGEETKLRLTDTLSNYKPGLLLDEPTTHLDQTSIGLLLEELEYYYGTLIFISHNRYFINKTATKIWEMDNGEIKVYDGNYDDYKSQKELEKLTLENRHKSITDEKKRLENAAKKQQAYAEKVGQYDKKKAKTNDPGHRGQSKPKDIVQKNAFKKVKAIENRMNQLDQVDMPDEQMNLKFPVAKTDIIHNKFPIITQGLTVRSGDKLLLDDISFQFEFGKTIAITGDNGSGKSSLLTEIINCNDALEISPKINIATYEQMDYKFHDETPIIKYLMKHTEFEEPMVRSILFRIGFAQSEVMKPMNKVSGGEATRISLALLFVKPSNVIVLDEPTNFIDLKTIEALETFINAYQGMVIVTSHDHEFISRVADEVFKIADRKLIRQP
ncbi:ribosomal protection-like ABC-F family protein [Salinicoccus sp. Marseille-QA3877]